jgi:hypothetical protein
MLLSWGQNVSRMRSTFEFFHSLGRNRLFVRRAARSAYRTSGWKNGTAPP